MAKVPLSELRAASLAGRSPLYRWMLDNASEMESVVSHGRPNWAGLAKTFGDAGVFDKNNHPPSAEVTRQTWFKVRKSLATKRVQTHPYQGAAPTVAPPKPESVTGASPKFFFTTLSGKKITIPGKD